MTAITRSGIAGSVPFQRSYAAGMTERQPANDDNGAPQQRPTKTSARPSPSVSALGPLVTAIDHVGIAVPDLDVAIAFYRETFGLELAHVEDNVEQGVREAMVRAVGDPGTGTAVQLLAPLTPDSVIGKFLDRNGPGLQQVAYRVTNVDAAAEALRAKGLRVLYAEARRGTNNSRVNFVHPKDSGGVLVELVEPAQR